MPEHIIDSKQSKYADGEWALDVHIYEPDEDQRLEIVKNIAKDFFPVLLTRVRADIPSLLSIPNFFGYAEDHMFRNKILFSKKRRLEYATIMYNQFITNLAEAVKLDEQNGSLYIDTTILKCEDGDTSFPGAHFLSRTLQTYLDRLYMESLQG